MTSNSFWLWFWRPIAETLVVLALISSVALIIIVVAIAIEWNNGRKNNK